MRERFYENKDLSCCPKCGSRLIHYKNTLICGTCGFKARIKGKLRTFSIPLEGLKFVRKSETH